jgi:hypothetical protein
MAVPLAWQSPIMSAATVTPDVIALKVLSFIRIRTYDGFCMVLSIGADIVPGIILKLRHDPPILLQFRSILNLPELSSRSHLAHFNQINRPPLSLRPQLWTNTTTPRMSRHSPANGKPASCASPHAGRFGRHGAAPASVSLAPTRFLLFCRSSQTTLKLTIRSHTHTVYRETAQLLRDPTVPAEKRGSDCVEFGRDFCIGTYAV